MKTITAARRRRLFGVLTTLAVGGTVTAAVAGPTATADKDPCSAGEISRTVSSVTRSTADYLDSHQETNQMLTGVLQQPAGPESVDTVNEYFDANPAARNDFVGLALPLVVANEQCKLSERLPALLAVFQAAQEQGKLPTIPGAPAIPGAKPPAAPAQVAPVAVAPPPAAAH